MAEFAKEALRFRRLDGDEIISLKWSESDRFEVTLEDHAEIVDNVKDQRKRREKPENKDGKQFD